MQGQCLCSPFSSFFSKGLGWIRGSDAPASPIQLISSTSIFSSSFSIPFTTSLIVLPLSVFLLLLHFHFSFGSVISALSVPEILILFSVPLLYISPLFIFPLSFHVSYTPTLSPPSPVWFNFISLNSTYTYTLDICILLSIGLSLLITFSLVFKTKSTWKVGGGGQERRRVGRKQGSPEPEGQLILIRLQPAY